MKQFTAYEKLGPFKAAIISVFAENIEAAKIRIEEELKKPGRGGYLKKWRDDGCIIKKTKC